MKALGRPIEAGERVDYLIVENPDAKYLGEKMVTCEVYKEGNYKIDYHYYLERQIRSHIDQIVSIC